VEELIRIGHLKRFVKREDEGTSRHDKARYHKYDNRRDDRRQDCQEDRQQDQKNKNTIIVG